MSRRNANLLQAGLAQAALEGQAHKEVKVDDPQLPSSTSSLLSSPSKELPEQQLIPPSSGKKRGRGRPPKNGICAAEPKPKSGRGRGRPRKDASPSATTSTSDSPLQSSVQQPQKTDAPPSAIAIVTKRSNGDVGSIDAMADGGLGRLEDLVIRNFQALLLTIDFIRKKHTPPTFSNIKQGVESITSDRFDAIDLENVLSVCAENFIVDWKWLSTEDGEPPAYHLCINIMNQSQEVNASTKPFSITERVENFSQKFAVWDQTGRNRVYTLPMKPTISLPGYTKKQSQFSELLSKHGKFNT